MAVKAHLDAMANGSMDSARSTARSQTDNGWNLKSLMEHDGWRDVKSAMRYIDGSEQAARLRIARSLHALPLPGVRTDTPAQPAPSTEENSPAGHRDGPD